MPAARDEARALVDATARRPRPRAGRAWRRARRRVPRRTSPAMTEAAARARDSNSPRRARSVSRRTLAMASGQRVPAGAAPWLCTDSHRAKRTAHHAAVQGGEILLTWVQLCRCGVIAVHMSWTHIAVSLLPRSGPPVVRAVSPLLPAPCGMPHVQVVVVVARALDDAPRAAQADARADEHLLRARGDEAVDEVLRERAGRPGPGRRGRARRPSRARVEDVDVEAVLVRGVAEAAEAAVEDAAARPAEVADEHERRRPGGRPGTRRDALDERDEQLVVPQRRQSRLGMRS